MLFPQSDSDVTKYRVSLLSMGLFPPSDNDSDIATSEFGMGSVRIC